jgi:dipeptidase E
MKKQRQIIAMGGGGFLMEPENPLLDQYILNASGKSKPKVCFIGTAGGDALHQLENFYKCFGNLNCTPAHLSLFRGETDKIEKLILTQDVLYVGGGNTRNLLLLWKSWNVDKYILKAYQKGTVLAGVSAGSICWFEQGLTDSIPTKLTKLKCLGILKGSNCPHFDGEAHRQSVFKKMIRSGEMKAGIAADDGCGLHYINEELFKIISSRKNAGAYSFKKKDGKLIEKEFIPEYLGTVKSKKSTL